MQKFYFNICSVVKKNKRVVGQNIQLVRIVACLESEGENVEEQFLINRKQSPS